MKLKCYLIYIFLIVSLCASYSQTSNKQPVLDAIEVLIYKSKKSNLFSNQERLAFALKAKELADSSDFLSGLVQSNLSISNLYWEMGLDHNFKTTNFENLKLAFKANDSLSLANTHYNLGEFYRLKSRLSDSAYFYYHNAEKLFKALRNSFNTAQTLLRIAVIQKNEKDFIGSEVTSIEAISQLDLLESTNEVKEIKSFIFNNLGLVFGQMEQFEESVLYFNKALDLKKDLPGDNKLSIYRTINNLALSYNNSGDHEVAIKNYNIILDDKKTISERPDFYALVLDNYANTLFLSKNYERLPDLYLKALKICDSLGDNSAKYNSIVINQHLAEYYHTFNQKDSAKYYAYRAKNISEEYHNDDLLKSLLLLSKIEDDRTAVKFYNAYIKLNDSLVKVERTTRNKFARIRFETKEIEQKNIQIAREKLWLTIISIIILTSAILIYIIINQRSKNKELQFVQKQQETNEEIYNLMLTQQEKIEEARILEKKNISQELHDGVLGRLFGTRLSLDSLNMATSAEAIETRNRYIQDLQKIENDIRKVSHELNTDFISGSGFVDIIKSLLETQTKAYKLNYKFDYDDSINWEDLTNKNKIHVYRILQESIHNIFKHANANIIKIGIQLKNNVILVSIKDDGSGFDVNKAKSGIGLKNINSRVEEINGQLSIESVKDVGTTVKIRVPI